MKKIMIMLLCAVSISFAAKAQEEVKVKKTTTPTQKIHNTFSKNKKYKGYKIKRKNGDKTTTTIVDTSGKKF